jgi:hypothetical protein
MDNEVSRLRCVFGHQDRAIGAIRIDLQVSDLNLQIEQIIGTNHVNLERHNPFS